MAEDKTDNKQQEKLDGLERLRAYREKNAQQEDIEVRRWKMLGRMFALFVLCAVLIYGAKAVQWAYIHLHNQSRMNEMSVQISQLVDNVRQLYARQGEKMDLTPDYLKQFEAIPREMIAKNGKLINPFGGKVVLQPSLPVKGIAPDILQPTFKVSMQGLPHQVCVKLAQMDWGSGEQGLQAVALGVADDAYDMALTDVDRQTTEAASKPYQDENGRWRLVKERQDYLLNVARPNDVFRPTPFKENDAIAGCACGNENRCSIALRYAY